VHIYVRTLAVRALTTQADVNGSHSRAANAELQEVDTDEDCLKRVESLATTAELQEIDTDEDSLKRVESRATTAELQEIDTDEEDFEDLILFDEASSFDDSAEDDLFSPSHAQAAQTVGSLQERARSAVKGGRAFVGSKWDAFGPMLNSRRNGMDDSTHHLEDDGLQANAISEKPRITYEDGFVSNKTKNKLNKDFESLALNTYSKMWRGLDSARHKVKVNNMRQGIKNAQGKVAVMSKSVWGKTSCDQEVHDAPQRRHSRISV
jgi:hypothetical protein